MFEPEAPEAPEAPEDSGAPIPQPQEGGSYAYDPETNTLTRRPDAVPDEPATAAQE